jgi:hypothetical protein
MRKDIDSTTALAGDLGVGFQYLALSSALLRKALLVLGTMRALMDVVVVEVVVVATMIVTMTTQDGKSNEIRGKAESAYYEHNLRVVDLRRVEESGNGFEDDRNAQGDQENGVEKGT